jgi:GntR family transcriptional regulator / MocR family aminotransferase
MLPKYDAANILAVIERKLDRKSTQPLYRQLYKLIRDMIVEGELRARARLPSTRSLADGLGLSRHTVSTAVEQLLGEGYLVGRPGSGTYVSGNFAARCPERLLAQPGPPQARLSQRGQRLSCAGRSPFNWDLGEVRAGFPVGMPAVDHFPATQWARVLAQAWRDTARGRLGYQHPLGHAGLRQEIAAYLRASRGLACTGDQVVIAAGSQNSLDLSYRLLADPGDVVAMEDPGYLGARAAASAAGLRIAAVPVDNDGLDVSVLEALEPAPRLVFVTPTHQFPLGVTMSLERRLALVAWARQTGAWILEDDYDSEYRYGGRQLDPLTVLDRAGRVVYIGTFSKVLFPSLRLGYLVLPPGLVDGFEAAHLCSDIHRPVLEQAALARFMGQGHFAQHLRRTRELHAERRTCLLEAARHRLSGLLDVQPAIAGLHLLGRLPEGLDDQAVRDAAAGRGLDVWPLSLHAVNHPGHGLLLGYGGVSPALISSGVTALAGAIEETLSQARAANDDPPADH